MPGWTSAAGAGLWSNVFFWVGIAALLFLGASEVISHRYTERKDELVAEEQKRTERQHRDEIARLDLETAQANERSAVLEKDAAELKASNLSLEQQIAPRRLKPEDIERLILILRHHPGETIAIESYSLDAEAAAFGEQILRILRAENFPFDDRRMSLSVLGNILLGLRVTGTDAAFASDLRDLFNSSGLSASDQPPSLGTGMTMGNPLAAAPVNLFIGVKPVP
jgi:hypothetical protein